MRVSASEASAYAGSAVSLGGAVTLTNVGVVVGILTALMTFGLNAYFMSRKRTEEAEEHRERMRLMLDQQRAIEDAPQQAGKTGGGRITPMGNEPEKA